MGLGSRASGLGRRRYACVAILSFCLWKSVADETIEKLLDSMERLEVREPQRPCDGLVFCSHFLFFVSS